MMGTIDTTQAEGAEMKEVQFQRVKDGDAFESLSGSFVKINENCAKRTEDHWKSSKKVWRFSPISRVLVEE